MLCFSSGWGFSWLSRGASLCWDELTCSPGAAVEEREREKVKKSTLGRANPDFRMCCSRLLSLTGGCNSHREECKTLIGPPTLVQCFGQSWRLICIIVVTVHFLLQARVKLRIKGCDLEKCPRLIYKHRLLLSCTLCAPWGEQRPQRDVAAKPKPPKSQTEKQWTDAPLCCKDVQEKSPKILTKPIKTVFPFLNDSLDESWTLIYPVQF